MGDASLATISYGVESTYATPPGGAYQLVRMAGETLKRDQQNVASAEFRPSALAPQPLRVGFAASGEVNGEQSFAAWAPWVQYGLRSGAFAGFIAAPAVNISVSVSGNETTFTRASGSWATDGFVDNGLVRMSGSFTNALNLGVWKVKTTAVAVDLVCYGVGATETAAAGKNIRQLTVLNSGKTLTTMTIEREYQDLTSTEKIIEFPGMAIQTMDFSARRREVLGWRFGFLGQQERAITASGASSKTAASSNQILTHNDVESFSFGSYETGALIHFRSTVLLGFTLSVNNNLYEIGTGSTITAIGLGEQKISGSCEFYYNSSSIFDNFESNSDVSFLISWKDATGNATGWEIPRAKFTLGDRSVPRKNEGVVARLDFEAYEDTAENPDTQAKYFRTGA